jgi:hypothetical protein
MRAVLSAALVLAAVAPAWSAPPALKLTDETKPGSRWVVVRAETEGTTVRFVPLDAGLDPFPLPLADKKTFVAFGEPGRSFKILAYTAVGSEPSEPAVITVTVGGKPKDPPTKDPPVTPVPQDGFHFVIVRVTGPADPKFTKWMADPSWQALRAAGHRLSDKTQREAAADLGITLPNGLQLPLVVALRVEGSESVVVGEPMTFPWTAADVLALPSKVTK